MNKIVARQVQCYCVSCTPSKNWILNLKFMQLSDMEGPCLLANTNLLTDILNSGVRRVGGSVTAVSVHGAVVSVTPVSAQMTRIQCVFGIQLRDGKVILGNIQGKGLMQKRND